MFSDFYRKGKWNHKNHKTQQNSIVESENEITKNTKVKQMFSIYYRNGKWNHKTQK